MIPHQHCKRSNQTKYKRFVALCHLASVHPCRGGKGNQCNDWCCAAEQVIAVIAFTEQCCWTRNIGHDKIKIRYLFLAQEYRLMTITLIQQRDTCFR